MIGYYKSLDTSNQIVNKRHNIFSCLYGTNLNKQLSFVAFFHDVTWVPRQGFTSCFPVAAGFIGCLKLRDVEVEDEGQNTLGKHMSMPNVRGFCEEKIILLISSSGMVKSHMFLFEEK